MKRTTSTTRSARMLLSLAFKASPLHAGLALTPFYPIAAGIGFAAVRQMIDAAQRDDTTVIIWSVAVFTVAWLAGSVLGRIGNLDRLLVGEAMAYEVDGRLIEAASAITLIDELDRPQYVDDLEVVRTQREQLKQAPRTGGWLVDGAGGLIIAIVLLVTVDPLLVFLPLAGIPALVLGNWAQRRYDRAVQADAERSRRTLHLFDVAASPAAGKEVRVFGLRDELLDRYQAEWQASDADLFRASRTNAAARTIGGLIALAAFVIALLVVVQRARTGEISPGDIFVVLSLMTQVVAQLANAANGAGALRRSLDVAARVAAIQALADHDRREQSTRRGALPHELQSGIVLDHVAYRYLGAAEPALRDVSLTIPAGSVVAFVGDNGAGKSTMVKLLLGLIAPTSGSIKVDGVDLGSIPSEDWRDRIGVCFQDFQRFEFVAREGIGIGDLAHLDNTDTLLDAARRAQATDVLDELPDGLDTQLGTMFSGRDLSGGQWQKVAIARGMMRPVPLLLALDEPTSALDPLAEGDLLEAYATTSRELATGSGAITVLVSHRFSSVRIADLIVVLDDGGVREVGSHQELMANNDRYAELYSLQARHYR